MSSITTEDNILKRVYFVTGAAGSGSQHLLAKLMKIIVKQINILVFMISKEILIENYYIKHINIANMNLKNN